MPSASQRRSRHGRSPLQRLFREFQPLPSSRCQRPTHRAACDSMPAIIGLVARRLVEVTGLTPLTPAAGSFLFYVECFYVHVRWAVDTNING
ncbi:hypothetical protein LSAT2_012271 [Lamellibrachia satsuma]|nr:hypothetical protein LSAT2_012271 [Lamellibrachia satsuma]